MTGSENMAPLLFQICPPVAPPSGFGRKKILLTLNHARDVMSDGKEKMVFGLGAQGQIHSVRFVCVR